MWHYHTSCNCFKQMHVVKFSKACFKAELNIPKHTSAQTKTKSGICITYDENVTKRVK